MLGAWGCGVFANDPAHLFTGTCNRPCALTLRHESLNITERGGDARRRCRLLRLALEAAANQPRRQEHGDRTGERARRPLLQRARRVVVVEAAALDEAGPLVAAGVHGREVERVALADVLRRPGLRLEFELLGVLEVRVLVLGHPARVVQQALAAVRVRSIELRSLGFVSQILAERLQEHGVEPAPLRVVQPSLTDVVRGVNHPPYQLFSLLDVP